MNLPQVASLLETRDPWGIEKAKAVQMQGYLSGIPEYGTDMMRFALYAYEES